MGRSSYTQSVSSSTRTFQTSPPAADVLPPKVSRKLPKIPHVAASRLPWLIVIGLVLISLFLFNQYREAQSKLASPQATGSSKQVSQTLTKVAKLVIVPTDETPTVVTVADTNKLKNQTFFSHAKIGDKVIVYARAKQAILYRPSTNQIVNMAPVTAGTN